MTEITSAISKSPDLMQALVNDLIPSLDEAMDAYNVSGSKDDFMVWNEKFVSDYADKKLAARLNAPEKPTATTIINSAVDKALTPLKSPSKPVKPTKAKNADKSAKAPVKPAQTPVKSDKPPLSGKVETSLTPAEKAKRETVLKVVTDTIRKETSNIANSYMRIGYQLWVVRERKLYLAADLKNVYEYAEMAFGFKISSAKNFIAVCEHFSSKDKDGKCTDKIDPAFAMFGYTQLSVMLPLSDEQLANVKPEMSKREIHALKSGQPVGQSDPDDDETPAPDAPKPTKTVCYDGDVTAQTWDRLLEKLEKSCMGKHIQITIIG